MATAKKTFKNNVEIYVSEDLPTPVYEQVGFVKDFSVEPQIKAEKEKFVNGEGDSTIVEETLNMSFSPVSISVPLWKKLTCGLISSEDIAGASKNANQVILSGGWKYKQAIKLLYENSDKTQPTISSVTASVDGVLASGDYEIIKKEDEYFIVLFDTATLTTENQNITIAIAYTDTDHERFGMGGKIYLNKIKIKIVSQDEGIEIEFHKCEYASGGFIKFGNKGSVDSANIPVTLTVSKDTTKPEGYQLYEGKKIK